MVESPSHLPRILIIDDLFGRILKDRPNRERANLCGMYGLRDVTGDEKFSSGEEVVNPLAEAVFYRGQSPLCAAIGDSVENDIAGTIEFVRKGWQSAPRWSLVLLDLCFYTGRVTPASDKSQSGMPKGRSDDDDARQYFGLRILERLHAEFPELPVIILSSKQREEVSQSFATHGALGFIPRTDSTSPEKLRDYLWRHGLTPDDSGQIVGHSLSLLLALRAARRAASDRRNVLIRGERGAGKELLADYMNRNASKGDQTRPLVTVDSGALSPTLFASELFGHVKGAYTGADREREGRIVQAHGGDLFLDEIGNMPPDVQTGLLRVLETKLVTPVGASSKREVDVRFIAATNEDIEIKAASGGGFRPDLLDRLREGGTIVLPPLRERREDIPLLAEQFVRQAEAARSGALKRKITPEAMEKILHHNWPGNIRELRNCILKAVNDHPDVEHLVPDHLVLEPNAGPPASDEKPRLPVHDPRRTRGDVTEMIRILEQTEVSASEVTAWAGRWPQVQDAYAGITLKLLRASLLATRRVSPESPHGEIKIHPAIKLLTGDSSLTATQAADTVKRIFSSLSKVLLGEALLDPVLKAAHDTSVRLRPRSSAPRKKKDSYGTGTERKEI
ncbi:MAG: sigma-54-dependent Fis family transcriptional regulator [Verrucomicrobia bacterium]|nr:sigma-54-dependent Fis family transcriptional regulator [Verrucomicrobiota bacterium]